MYRAWKERQLALKKWRLHNIIIHSWDVRNQVSTDAYSLGPPTCPCDTQPNRFRKGQPVAGRCGNPRCTICYRWDPKRLKVATHRVRKEATRMQHELEDAGESTKWFHKANRHRQSGW